MTFYDPPTPLDRALDPLGYVEPHLLLTPQERDILDRNHLDVDQDCKYFTIYQPWEIPTEHFLNGVNIWIPKMKAIEADYGYELKRVSIYRSWPHQVRVYEAKGITDLSKIPSASWHMKFLADDSRPVKMPIAHYHGWLTEKKLEQHNIWMEHESHTPSWGHTQGRPYGSWKPGKSRKYHI